jgi:uncharacterized iron-regulated membrane protein
MLDTAFRYRPPSVTIRRILFQVHRWVGLVAGLYFFVVAATGAVLMWRIDLQRLTYPHLFSPSASGPPVAPEIVLEGVRAAYPHHRVSGIDAPTTSRPTFLAYATQGRAFATILADPATGRVLGELPDTGPVRALQDLHFDLLGGRTGRIVNGIGALCLLTMGMTGAVIWWPGIRRLRAGFGFGAWRRVTWELHNATGIWTLVFITMWAITGVAFAFPSAYRSIVGAFSSLTIARPPASDPSHASTSTPSWHELIDRARQHIPDQHVARVVVPASDADAFLVMFSPVAPTPAGGASLTPVYLDQFSGAILADAQRSRRTAGDIIMAWTAPLHVGNFAGTGVKIVWTIAGLAPALLFVTGLMIWFKRPRVPARTSAVSGYLNS